MTGLGEVNQVKVVKEMEQGGSLMDQGFFFNLYVKIEQLKRKIHKLTALLVNLTCI